jgi:hypothetical protein
MTVSPADYHREFWSIVNSQLSIRGLRLSRSCAQDMDELITQGAETLYRSEGGANEASEAEDRLREFVNAMMRAAQGRGIDELDDDLFFSIKSFFCPGMWPFC